MYRMKRMKLFLLAALIMVAASAYTVNVNPETEYYTTDGIHFAPKGNGSCSPGSFSCTYRALVPEEELELDNPDHFEAEEPLGFVWIAS